MKKITTAFFSCTSLIVLGVGVITPANAAYIFTDLGTLDGNLSIATSVNGTGQAVGWASSLSYGETRPIYWNGAALADLGTLGGSTGYAYEINDANQVAGWSTTAGIVGGHATLWSSGIAIDLGTLGGSYSEARAINNAGQVVGFSLTVGEPSQINTTTGGAYHATLWNGGTTTDLGTLSGWRHSFGLDVNNVGQVAGVSYTTGGADGRATLWNNGTIIDLGTLGGQYSEAIAINDAGQVAGASYTTGNAAYHATLWNNGTIIDLDTLGGSLSIAMGINDAGQVVGYSDTTDNAARHAVLWNGTTIIDLNSLLDATTISEGWELRSANDINNSGWIAGGAYNRFTGQYHGFLLSEIHAPINAVPEPETYSMLLAGLGLWGFTSWRRKQNGAILGA